MPKKIKNDMTALLEQQNETEKPELSIIEPIPESHKQRTPKRQGKKMAAVYLDPDDHRRLKILCIELGITMEEFLKAGINQKCQLHNKPPIA